MSIDPKSYQEALAQLTGPGSPFELQIESLRGRPTRNFAKRPRSLPEFVIQSARHGEREFLIQGERRISYQEFASLDYIICVFAASALGAITVALNGWWVEEELDQALRDSGSRFLMVDSRLYPRVRQLVGGLESLTKILFSGAAAPEGTIPLADVIQTHPELTPLAEIHEDDPFVILYTSGTTGRPKGCITTHRGTITQVMGILLYGCTGRWPEHWERPARFRATAASPPR